MAFRGQPTTIKDPQADAKAINDNFDEIHSDLIDTGGLEGSEATVGPISLNPASSVKTHRLTVHFTNAFTELRGIYTRHSVPIIMRTELYVDVDNDQNYLWPAGSQLSLDSADTAAFSRLSCLFTVHNGIRAFGSDETKLTSYYILLRNDSFDTHDYYIHVSGFIYPTPHNSRFR